jgi:replication factor C subunit 2/4
MKSTQSWIEKYRPLKIDDIVQQTELIEILNNTKKTGELPHLLMYGAPGTGKCLGYDTNILMYNGEIKKVQDIINGELLMGDNGDCRNVLNICEGKSIMYKINQKYGDFYIVNSDHILSLIDNNIKIDICVEEYLEKKLLYKGYKVSKKINCWKERKILLDPFEFAMKNDEGITDDYKINSIEIREKILEAYKYKYKFKNGYKFPNNIILKDIKFIVGSLGKIIYETQNNIWNIIEAEPYEIKIEKLEENNYYGFEINGNKRFLLGDFTVTHNTSSILAICKELFPKEIYNDRVIELNASDERGIDIVRTKIISFAKLTVGENKYAPPYKIIILDEADAMTIEAQSALRKVIEELSGITRFCFLCNYINQIIDPIVSRCLKIRFRPITKKNMVLRLSYICQKEKMNIDENIIETIAKLSKGDVRKGITTLQNLKYLIKLKKTIDSDDIYDMLGYIPIKKLKIIWVKCFEENIKIKQIIKELKIIKTNGYLILSVLDQIKESIRYEDELDGIQKSLLFIHLSNIEKRLNEGSNEYLQILSIFSYLISVIKKETTEIIVL